MAQQADFVLDRRSELRHFRLLATRGTGTIIQKRTHLLVPWLEPGLAGGDQQVRWLAAAHEIGAVIFPRDPDGPPPYEPTFAGLQQVCDSLEISLATHAATMATLLFFLRTVRSRRSSPRVPGAGLCLLTRRPASAPPSPRMFSVSP